MIHIITYTHTGTQCFIHINITKYLLSIGEIPEIHYFLVLSFVLFTIVGVFMGGIGWVNCDKINNIVAYRPTAGQTSNRTTSIAIAMQ
jgi:hypothetical protein